MTEEIRACVGGSERGALLFRWRAQRLSCLLGNRVLGLKAGGGHESAAIADVLVGGGAKLTIRSQFQPSE